MASNTDKYKSTVTAIVTLDHSQAYHFITTGVHQSPLESSPLPVGFSGNKILKWTPVDSTPLQSNRFMYDMDELGCGESPLESMWTRGGGRQDLFLIDRLLNGVCVHYKALLVACASLCQSTTVTFGEIFLKRCQGCSIFVPVHLAIIRSRQCICQFGEKMNKRSYGCHLKVCFF